MPFPPPVSVAPPWPNDIYPLFFSSTDVIFRRGGLILRCVNRETGNSRFGALAVPASEEGIGMFRINNQGFVVDCEDDQPVALVSHGCVAVEARMQDQRCVLLRFDGQQNLPPGARLSAAQVHQFALPLEQALALARAILTITEPGLD
ncbi:hypothetical protein [Paracoccus sp. N5]|uniref:hypothetical protein n=1 Tax=Paracoccus sp. N5 TaxID=1101189 RepID=UPI0012FC41C5|nr:hypothetical protein [Paracoccus sp. N5]